MEEEKKPGRKLKSASLVIFIFTALFTILMAGTFALPIFVLGFGVVSVLLWLVVVAIASIFTLFLIWTSPDFKSFNDGWMAFNERIFNSSENLANIGMRIVPTLAIIGGVFFVICWTLMIIGLAKYRVRRKYFLGMSIALGVLTIGFIIMSIASILIIKNM